MDDTSCQVRTGQLLNIPQKWSWTGLMVPIGQWQGNLIMRAARMSPSSPPSIVSSGSRNVNCLLVNFFTSAPSLREEVEDPAHGVDL